LHVVVGPTRPDLGIRHVAHAQILGERVTAREHMSRSVTTPTNRPLSTTGKMPQSPSSISAAADARFESGEQVLTSDVMASLIFIHASFLVTLRV
jgi:hypothetical protein